MAEYPQSETAMLLRIEQLEDALREHKEALRRAIAQQKQFQTYVYQLEEALRPFAELPVAKGAPHASSFPISHHVLKARAALSSEAPEKEEE